MKYNERYSCKYEWEWWKTQRCWSRRGDSSHVHQLYCKQYSNKNHFLFQCRDGWSHPLFIQAAAYSSSTAGTFLSDNVVLWAPFELLPAVSNLLVAFFRKAERLSPAFAYLIRHRRCLPGDTEMQSGVKRPVFICVIALMSISAMDHLTYVDRPGVDPRLTSYPGYIVDAASRELLSMLCGSRRAHTFTQAVWKHWSAKEQQTNARFPEEKLEGRKATSTQETRTRVPPPYCCSTLHPAQRQNTL